MNTETLKIDIAQKILDLSDDKLLKKISQLLHSEYIVGYNVDGKPICESDYLKDITESMQLFRENKLETFSTDEVRKQILNK